MTAQPTGRAIGVPTPRVDGVEKATGRATYTADILLDGALFAKTLRCPFPYARILSIDTSAAGRVPGVHAVVTGADIHEGARHGRAVLDVPVLAQGVARFIGEQVAAVAADDEDIAQRALDLIEVEYEELPAVLTMDEAKAEGAPLVHEDMLQVKGYPKEVTEPSNVYTVWEWAKGDVDAGMDLADVIVENTFTTPRQHQAYLEPHTCLVVAQPSGKVDVWAGNKSPHPGKRMVAMAIGLDAADVVFNPVTIGGDFGGKGSAMAIPIAWMLSTRTGRPVKIVFDYSEDLTSANPRHESRVTVRTGATRDGLIVAHEALVEYNSGAYAGFKPGGHLGGASAAAGPYRAANTRIIEHQVYTNNVPCGFMRGPGEPQAMFAVESQIDCLAAALGMDPAELRRKNLVIEGEEDSLGTVFEQVRSIETLNAALETAGYALPPSLGRAFRLRTGCRHRRTRAGRRRDARGGHVPPGWVGYGQHVRFRAGHGLLHRHAADRGGRTTSAHRACARCGVGHGEHVVRLRHRRRAGDAHGERGGVERRPGCKSGAVQTGGGHPRLAGGLNGSGRSRVAAGLTPARAPSGHRLLNAPAHPSWGLATFRTRPATRTPRSRRRSPKWRSTVRRGR